ncbi:MAG TPA: glycoside hydrolase domain-containing protein, partial [Tepidisphaeraceae bacterium]|nr:glycoside hydrolase domain-containing protein [Tepidisphaeraceae bacterium]
MINRTRQSDEGKDIMRVGRIGWLATMILGSMAMAQTVPVDNASFEEGKDGPAGWKMVGGKGEWLSEGAAEGKRAVAVVGGGEDHSYWQTGPMKLETSAVYRLTFRARSLGMAGGTAISGPAFCNRDLGSISEQWQTYESIFVTPEKLRPEDALLRLGQWQVRGKVAFDDVRLQRATAVYAREGELVLGEGESVAGQEYGFEAPLGGESRNHSRPLVGYTCTFNSDRWVVGDGGHVVYRHEIAGRKQTAGEVHVSVTWYAKGELAVEIGTDGKIWRQVGTIGKQAEGTFKIPTEMLPAERVWVRLRGQGGASLQVGAYGYKATLSGPGATLMGATRFAATAGTDTRLAVMIEDMGQAIPGGKNRLVARIKNSTSQTIAAEPTVTVRCEGHAPAIKKLPMSLPPGETRVELPYEMAGTGVNTIELTLGNAIDSRAEVAVRVADLYDASYGQRLPSGNGAAGLWWTSSGWKISRTRPVPEAAGEAMVIHAARNEAEAAQLVIRPSKPLRGLTTRAESLAGPGGAQIPAENVEILRVKYLTITKPTDHTGVVAPWPDPLIPMTSGIDVEEQTNQPLWVRVKVPKDAKAGTYRGKIHLSGEGYSETAALNVEVYGFDLPDRMTCQTAFGFSPGEVWRYHKLEKAEDRRAVLEKYWASFGAHHITPYDPAPLDPIKVTWPDRKTFMPAFDFAAWDAAMTRAFEKYHFNSFQVHIPGMGGGTFHSRVEPELLGYRESQPEYKLAFTNYCKTMEEHLRQKGWLGDAFVYWFDEPDPKDYQFVMNGFRKLKEAAPGLTRMLTEQVEPSLVGGPNLWCPITPEYKHEPAEQRREAGDRFWWYVCTGPKAPYCTLFIDHPATELRVWLWQTWQRKINGILVWQTNYWTSPTAYPDAKHVQNPYEDPMSWT